MRAALAVALALTVLGASACAQSKPDTQTPPPGHSEPAPVSPALAAQLDQARAATAKYAVDLAGAQAAGYKIITKMMPGMGYHYLNPDVQGFDITKPAILVYQRHGDSWELGALEWVWPETPASPPLEGATYGSFDAACHFADGTFVAAAAEKDCAALTPETGVAFGFWHPKLVTLHVWLWEHNPAGLYSPTNPLVPREG